MKSRTMERGTDLSRLLAASAILGSIAASGCTVEFDAPPAPSEIPLATADEVAPAAAEPEGDAPASVEDVNVDQSALVINQCPGGLPSCSTCGSHACGQACCATEREPGFEISYPDDCSSWTRPSWQPTSDPPLLCQIDPDRHWDGVEIELYAAKRYEDTSCMPWPSRWEKNKVAEVGCSWWTALTDGSECGRRVLNKVTALAAAGYVPYLPDPEGDNCPTGAAPPPPPLPPPPPNDDPCSKCRAGYACFRGDGVCRSRSTQCP
jgi:hypothetical protein